MYFVEGIYYLLEKQSIIKTGITAFIDEYVLSPAKIFKKYTDRGVGCQQFVIGLNEALSGSELNTVPNNNFHLLKNKGHMFLLDEWKNILSELIKQTTYNKK
ncbi:MAG: hypothetical protein HQ541_23720 [Mariniphaga sp.]|nr:hypothetical protein [Mariniphaga sp.]